MRAETIIFLACVAFAAGELVYLEDLNEDHDKRNLHFGLPDILKFNLRHGGGELELNLKENKRVNQMAPMYVTDPHNANMAVQATASKNHRVKYYQDKRNGAYLVGECEDSTHGPCTRKLTGNLHVDGKEFKLEPSVADKRTFSSNLGATHTMTALQRKSYATRGVGNMAVSEEMDYAVQPDEDFTDDEKVAKEAELLERLLERLEKGMHNVNKRASPVVHGVEMLMVLDHGIYEMFQDMYSGEETILMKIREYFSHILNGVDLRYMSIEENDVSFYITVVGFFISKSEGESPWMTYNNGNPDGLAGLQNMISWRQNTGGLPEHDHAALITGYNIHYSGSTSVVGIAYLNGVCNDYRVSINEEYGFFEGAGVLAHELGHNLGAPHDAGSSNGPCDPSRQFVMAPYVPNVGSSSTNTEPWHFSSCSVESFRSYVNGMGSSSCTLDTPDIYDEGEFNDNTDNLAGTEYTGDEQCELLLGSGATMCTDNQGTDDVCRNFRCKSAGETYCYSFVAAYGTPCGVGKMCYNGLCQDTECKGRQCTEEPYTGPTSPSTPTPTPSSTTGTPFTCTDTGVASYTCLDLGVLMGGGRALCSRFTRECCSTCSQTKFCKKEKIIKLGKKKYSCAEMVERTSFSITCHLFTDRCCKTCAAY